MAPFAMALRELGPVELKFFSQVAAENTHNIQTHVVDLGLLVSGRVVFLQSQTFDPACNGYTTVNHCYELVFTVCVVCVHNV